MEMRRISTFQAINKNDNNDINNNKNNNNNNNDDDDDNNNNFFIKIKNLFNKFLNKLELTIYDLLFC